MRSADAIANLLDIMDAFPFASKELGQAAQAILNQKIGVGLEPTYVETELYRAGKKIAAIKAYRSRTGASLLESKKAIEALDTGDGFQERGNPVDGFYQSR